MALSSGMACQAFLDLHTAPDAGVDGSAPVDATTAESGAADSASDASPPIECGKGRFYCATFNACVDRGDPAFGCGAADCKPCGGARDGDALRAGQGRRPRVQPDLRGGLRRL